MEQCTQEERISKIESAVEQIGGKVNGLYTDFQLIKAKLEEVLNSVAEHDRALKGNNGTIGLIAKVANALEVLNDLQEALRGKGEKPGLIATINQLNQTMGEWGDMKKWFVRLVAGWAITSVLIVILEMMTR